MVGNNPGNNLKYLLKWIYKLFEKYRGMEIDMSNDKSIIYLIENK